MARRSQAALAAGLLAFSAAAPPALAQGGEVDHEQEGMAEPGGDAPGLEPDFDPGGEDTLDVDTGPVPAEPGAGGQEDDGLGAPIDTEPSTDPDAPRVLEEPEQTPEPEQATPEPAPAPAPTAPVPAPPAPPPAPPVAEVEPPPPTPESPNRSTDRRAPERAANPRPREPKYPTDANPAPVGTEPAPAAPAPAPVADSSQPTVRATTVAVSQPTARAAGPVTGEGYTVQPGDSLWTIARGILGPEASAGQIAREVNRLWKLNQARIGTGNPSLIHVGTVLEL